MGMLRYALLNIKKDLKNNSIYVFAIVISFITVLMVLNCFTNATYFEGVDTVIVDESQNEIVQLDAKLQFFIEEPTLLHGQNFLILFLVVLIFTYFCNSYFIKNKGKEFAFFTLNGATLGDRVKYIMFENSIFFLIGGAIGTVLGFIFVPLSNILMYSISGHWGDIWTINFYMFKYTLLVFLFEFGLLALLNLGDVYRREPVELLNLNNNKSQIDSRHVKVPNIVFVILFLIPIIFAIFGGNTQGAEYAVYVLSFGGLFGLYGIIKYFVPSIGKKLSRMSFTYKGLKKIYIGNFISTLRGSLYFILGLVLSLLYYSMITVRYSIVEGAISSSLYCYVITSMLVGLALLYKTIVEWERKIKEYRQLKILGYSKEEIINIIYKENILFFGVGLMLPVILLLSNFIVYIIAGYFSSLFSLFLIISAVGPITIIGILATIRNKNKIIKEIYPVE
ncbi:FtsX-like permease family protein [Clostridium paraputrificum]|uniref:FtsX-like permease family protein n=1 Tax=Clostridium paraputrificum TaxID=29363 RepID=UPI0006C1F9C2|nr:FtsX-like permease family protein [Clostridium paraputrificum]CUQ33874.1 ABC transporter permease [Clostridium paraputrificum]